MWKTWCLETEATQTTASRVRHVTREESKRDSWLADATCVQRRRRSLLMIVTEPVADDEVFWPTFFSIPSFPDSFSHRCCANKHSCYLCKPSDDRLTALASTPSSPSLLVSCCFSLGKHRYARNHAEWLVCLIPVWENFDCVGFPAVCKSLGKTFPGWWNSTA